MTKTKRNTGTATEDAFHKHYAAIWGEERWRRSLYPVLAEPTRYAALINQYSSTQHLYSRLAEIAASHEAVEQLALPALISESVTDSNADFCLVRVPRPHHSDGPDAKTSTGLSFPPPQIAETSDRRLITHWNLDAASVLVAHLLDVRPGDRVLDLCAAPGGKSIALAQNLFPLLHRSISPPGVVSEIRSKPDGALHVNESDPKRYQRLCENLRAYLPVPLFTENKVGSASLDGTQPLTYQALSRAGGYDKVLVDAPCSSERHVIHAHVKARSSSRTAPEMGNWRPGSSKRLQEIQVKLLMTALKAAKAGGTVIYATCSIEPGENDGVIEKVRAWVDKERKKGGVAWSFKIGFNGGDGNAKLEAELGKTWAERTKYGWIVLPDHPGGGRWGPLFFATLNKTDASG